MREKFIEGLRSFLRKTVLPLRRKKEEILSKMRFSISFRIGLNYLRFFILYGVVFIIAFIAMFLFIESEGKLKNAKEYISEVGSSRELAVQHAEGYFDGLGINLIIRNEDDTVLFDNTEGEASQKYIFGTINYRAELESLTFKKNYVINYGGTQLLKFEFYVNMDEADQLLNKVLIPLILLMLVMIALILKSSNKQNEILLDPINSMSKTANRLTVNSLSQERLNIEGTQNELKDLAETINDMLDRLAVSYESQKQFVSDASHELRTPIAVIQGYINMLDRWGKNDEEVMEESIEAIKNEANSMKELVEKLLFLSRHDKKTMKLTKKFFEMSDIVDEMIKETRLVAKNRSVESGKLDKVMVFGDIQSIKQAIRVFIDNACKYSSDGDRIIISCINDNGDCIIKVTDTGMGMTKEDMDHIFERFYRSDRVRNVKIDGHGLGLSIAKLIVMKHSGTITVKSQLGVGTSFVVRLPKFKLW